MYASAQRRANSRNSVDFPMRRLPRQATNDEVRFRQSDSKSSSMSLRPTNIVVAKFYFSNLTIHYTIYAHLVAIGQFFSRPCREILFCKSHDTAPAALPDDQHAALLRQRRMQSAAHVAAESDRTVSLRSPWSIVLFFLQRTNSTVPVRPSSNSQTFAGRVAEPSAADEVVSPAGCRRP